MLWGRNVAKDFRNYVVVDYCQYDGPGYRKRKRIAHSINIQWDPRLLCHTKTRGRCIDGEHQVSAQRGPCKEKDERIDRCSLDTLHRLPSELTEEMLQICQQHIWE